MFPPPPLPFPRLPRPRPPALASVTLIFWVGGGWQAYIAFALFEAMDGAGTRDNRVARLLGGTDKRKMAAVAACYLDAYGRSLVGALKGDLSGPFLKVGAIALV